MRWNGNYSRKIIFTYHPRLLDCIILTRVILQVIVLSLEELPYLNQERSTLLHIIDYFGIPFVLGADLGLLFGGEIVLDLK